MAMYRRQTEKTLLPGTYRLDRRNRVLHFRLSTSIVSHSCSCSYINVRIYTITIMIRSAIRRTAGGLRLNSQCRRLSVSSTRHRSVSQPRQDAQPAVARSTPPPNTTASIPSGPFIHRYKPQQDDSDLRDLFDHPSGSRSSLTQPTGLFDYHLSSPESLRPLTERTLIHGQAIVDRIRNSPSDPKELRRVVKNLDRLSDILCGVIDMCELVRSVHPNQRWVDECDLAYERLCSFMNGLNTDRGLYEVCVSLLCPSAVAHRNAQMDD
jgi:intermediate peptidase